MKKIFSMLLILMTIFLFTGFAYSGNEGDIHISPTQVQIVPAYETNTDPTIDNVIEKAEEVKSLYSQWESVVSMIKKGGFGFSLLFFTIIPLLLVTLMTLGVVIVIVLRTITLFTPEEIDKKIDVVEDWITKYIIKIPITILSNIRKK